MTTHWPRSWDYPEEDEDEEMGSMGRDQAEAEEKLMLKQDAAEEMYEALLEIFTGIPITSPEIAAKVQRAIAKAEGRS